MSCMLLICDIIDVLNLVAVSIVTLTRNPNTTDVVFLQESQSESFCRKVHDMTNESRFDSIKTSLFLFSTQRMTQDKSFANSVEVGLIESK